MEEVEEIINNTRIKREPEIPFPQANDFEKCINLLEILENWEKTKVEIATEYSFHRRQADYYVNAAKIFYDLLRSKAIRSYWLEMEGIW